MSSKHHRPHGVNTRPSGVAPEDTGMILAWFASTVRGLQRETPPLWSARKIDRAAEHLSFSPTIQIDDHKYTQLLLRRTGGLLFDFHRLSKTLLELLIQLRLVGVLWATGCRRDHEQLLFPNETL